MGECRSQQSRRRHLRQPRDSRWPDILAHACGALLFCKEGYVSFRTFAGRSHAASAAPCRRLCAVYTDVRSSESRSNFIDLSDRFALASNLELSDEWVVNNAKGTQRLAVADLGNGATDRGSRRWSL